MPPAATPLTPGMASFLRSLSTEPIESPTEYFVAYAIETELWHLDSLTTQSDFLKDDRSKDLELVLLQPPISFAESFS